MTIIHGGGGWCTSGLWGLYELSIDATLGSFFLMHVRDGSSLPLSDLHIQRLFGIEKQKILNHYKIHTRGSFILNHFNPLSLSSIAIHSHVVLAQFKATSFRLPPRVDLHL
jgi:hypothetical protein